MLIAASIFTLLAVALHIFIWVLESFLWDKPRGMKVFNLTPEKAAVTKEIAVNQGLYNLFLALIALVGILGVWASAPWGAALVYAGAGSMAAAGIFLFTISPDKRRPALIQTSFPALAVLSLLLV